MSIKFRINGCMLCLKQLEVTSRQIKSESVEVENQIHFHSPTNKYVNYVSLVIVDICFKKIIL